MGLAGNARLLGAAALALAAPLLAGSTGRLTNLESRLLAAHNRERAEVGVPPLRWDSALAADAAAWAGELAASGAFEHAPDDPEGAEPEGENLWMGTKGAFSAEEMVGMWIEEKAHYRPAPIPHSSRTGDFADVGHYTQLVWAESGRVGCALAEGGGDDYLVCRYLQAGNVVGETAF